MTKGSGPNSKRLPMNVALFPQCLLLQQLVEGEGDRSEPVHKLAVVGEQAEGCPQARHIRRGRKPSHCCQLVLLGFKGVGRDVMF